jgi:hypothetical protein
MPIAAISNAQFVPAAAGADAGARPAAPAQGADTVNVSAQAKDLATPIQSEDIAATLGSLGGAMGSMASVHEFDPERMQRLLKLLE